MIKIQPGLVFGNYHIHTWRSDGELTELEVILHSLTNPTLRNIKISEHDNIQLTDHDNVKAWSNDTIDRINKYICNGIDFFDDGTIYPECPELVRREYIKYILSEGRFKDYRLQSDHKIEEVEPGILTCGKELRIGKGAELTADMGRTFHILGLLLSNVSKDFQRKMDDISIKRQQRAKDIIYLLYEDDYFFYTTLEYLQSQDISISMQQLQGFIGDKKPITWEDVKAVNPDAPSRLSIGFVLWKRYGPAVYWKITPKGINVPLTPEEVRDIYIKRLPKSRFPISINYFSPKEAIDQILDNGGIPVLAHPNENRDKDDMWLQKGFKNSKGDYSDDWKGCGIDKLIDEGKLSKKDFDYANKHSIMELFRYWGIRGVEHEKYATINKLLDFSNDQDYHGPNLKPGRKIMIGPLPSFIRVLNIKLVRDKHNELLNEIIYGSNPQYSKCRQAHEETRRITSSFPPEEQRTTEQQEIIKALSRRLATQENLTLEEYLDMARIYEKTPTWEGTVLEMEIRLRDRIAEMINTGSYLNEPPGTEYNKKIDAYLKKRLDTHTRSDILRDNLPFLHNIGKILTFGVREIKEKDGTTRYLTSFAQHDVIGKELIESIRNVLEEQQGLTNNEIDHIKDVTEYHINVHRSIYKIMDKQYNERSHLITKQIIERFNLKPDVILDSLLLIKAAGIMAYERDLSHSPEYTNSIDRLMKVCVDMLP